MRKPPPELFAPARERRAVPYDFVLEQLAPASPSTRAMFGSTAVYLDERVVFILHERDHEDDGVWFAYEPAREAEVLALFPSALRIGVIPNARGWRKLSASHESFEDDVLRACRIAREPDSPLGKVPMRRSKKRATAPSSASTSRGSRAKTPNEPEKPARPPKKRR